MKKPTRFLCHKKLILSLSLVTALSACGGGGGGSKPDTTSSGTQSTSSVVNSSSTSSTSSKSMSSLSSALATSSSSSVSFEPGTKPDAFSFTAVTDAKANSIVTSNPITVTGITKAIQISITGGEYAINNGDYTSTANTISNNQTVTIRVKSGSGSKVANSATLNLGGLTGSFNVTTIEDTAAPTAQIMFPTPVSLTEGSSILVRGIASDNVNEIESVTVNGVQATTTDGYANWQAEVPLNAGANDLVVNVTDAASNTASNAATAKIKSGSLAENRTSTTENVIDDPVGIAFDLVRNRAIVVDRIDDFYFHVLGVDLATGNQTVLTQYIVLDNAFAGIVLDNQNNRVLMQNAYDTYAMDLNTHKLSSFSTDNTGNEANPFDLPHGIALDKTNARALVAEFSMKSILSVNLTTGARTIFSDNTHPNSLNSFFHPTGIVVDNANNRALVTDTDYNKVNSSVLAINLVTGARSVLSNNTTPDTQNTLTAPSHITLDANRNRALVADDQKILAVDLTTGARSILSSSSVPDTVNKFSSVNNIAVSEDQNIALVAPYKSGAIYALDLITGKRVVFSK